MNTVKLLLKKASNYSLIFIWISLLLIAAVWAPRFFNLINFASILKLTAVLGIATLGEGLVLLSKGVDLSVGAVMGFTSIFSAVLIRSLGLFPAIALVLTVSLAIGLINGMLVTLGRLSPFVVTLAMMWILRGIAGVMTNGLIVPVKVISFTKAMTTSISGVLPYAFLGLLLLWLVLHFILNWTSTGRYLYAVGGSEEAAYYSGVDVNSVKVLVYVVAALLYGIAGLLFTSYTRCGMPFAAAGYEFRAITAAALGGIALSGGVGQLWKAVLGTLILTMLYSLVTVFAISPYVQGLFEGAILIGAVYTCQKMAA